VLVCADGVVAAFGSGSHRRHGKSSERCSMVLHVAATTTSSTAVCRGAETNCCVLHHFSHGSLVENWSCFCLMSKSKSKSKSKLLYDRRSVGQSVVVTGTHLGHNFSPYLFDHFWTVAGFVGAGPLSPR
jgi:hypothetical protein